MNKIGSKLPLWEGDKMLNIKKNKNGHGVNSTICIFKSGNFR